LKIFYSIEVAIGKSKRRAIARIIRIPPFSARKERACRGSDVNEVDSTFVFPFSSAREPMLPRLSAKVVSTLLFHRLPFPRTAEPPDRDEIHPRQAPWIDFLEKNPEKDLGKTILGPAAGSKGLV
jgi:hypothetical protein